MARSDDDVGRLFLEPPDRFVTARDALVKALRAEGEKERAAEVKKLKRPTAAAWAVDQLALRRPDDVAELLEAGAALRAAHEAALGGSGSAADLRAAADAERAAVEALTDDARTLLEEAELCSDAAVERVRQTLHGAASDAELQDQIRTGQLSNDRGAVGLGPGGLEVAAPARTPKARPKQQKATKATAPKGKAKGKDAEAKAKAEAARAAAEAKRRGREKRDAEKRRREEERRARRDLEAAEKAYERAREAAEQARAELQTREEELADARERLDAIG
jgi:hypothetical protein